MNVYASQKDEALMTLPRSAIRSRRTPRKMATIGEDEENGRQKSIFQVPPRQFFDTIEEEDENQPKSRARSVFSIKNEYLGFQPTVPEEPEEEPLRGMYFSENVSIKTYRGDCKRIEETCCSWGFETVSV